MGDPSEITSLLNAWAPRQAKVVELRYFGGLTEDEIEVVLKISPRTIRRDWDFAKAWLMRQLSHPKGKTTGLRT